MVQPRMGHQGTIFTTGDQQQLQLYTVAIEPRITDSVLQEFIAGLPCYDGIYSYPQGDL